MSKPVGYADLGDLEENKRIAIIGHHAIVHKRVVAFIVDDEPGKAERYIAKLRAQFPGIRVLDTTPGPVPATVTVRVAPPEETA